LRIDGYRELDTLVFRGMFECCKTITADGGKLNFGDVEIDMAGLHFIE